MRKTRPHEIDAVLKLDGPARFAHFVKRVVDEERAWGLWSSGWGLMANDDGAQVFPFWPASEYAERCRIGDWAGYEVKEISLDDLQNDVLPRMQMQGVLAGVFPTPGGKGVVVPTKELIAALAEEERRYE